MTTVTTGKLLLMTLTQRVSGKGNEYMQGILGGLNVIAFKGEPTEWGQTWNVYLQERAPKPVQSHGHGQQHPSPRSQAAADLFNRPLDRG
jgi:hypothetical protein